MSAAKAPPSAAISAQQHAMAEAQPREKNIEFGSTQDRPATPGLCHGSSIYGSARWHHPLERPGEAVVGGRAEVYRALAADPAGFAAPEGARSHGSPADRQRNHALGRLARKLLKSQQAHFLSIQESPHVPA